MWTSLRQAPRRQAQALLRKDCGANTNIMGKSVDAPASDWYAGVDFDTRAYQGLRATDDTGQPEQAVP